MADLTSTTVVRGTGRNQTLTSEPHRFSFDITYPLHDNGDTSNPVLMRIPNGTVINDIEQVDSLAAVGGTSSLRIVVLDTNDSPLETLIAPSVALASLGEKPDSQTLMSAAGNALFPLDTGYVIPLDSNLQAVTASLIAQVTQTVGDMSVAPVIRLVFVAWRNVKP